MKQQTLFYLSERNSIEFFENSAGSLDVEVKDLVMKKEFRKDNFELNFVDSEHLYNFFANY